MCVCVCVCVFLWKCAFQAVYFITELALAANPADFEEVYGVPMPEASLPGAPFRSNLFLSKIIRPIYNVVFDEWHPGR